MSRSQYPYPPDEFDVRSPDDAPVGVHRAPRSRWSGIWPFLLVAVIAVAVAVGGVMYFTRDKGTADDASGTTQTQSADAGSATGATDPATGDDTPGSDEPTDSTATPSDETPAPTDEVPTPTPTDATASTAPDLAALVAAADKGAFVRVLNDGGPAGEAIKGSNALKAQGFTHLEASNYPAGGSGLTETTIWYAPNRADTAAAVAAVLGVPSDHVVQQTVRTGDVVVVVKSALTLAD